MAVCLDRTASHAVPRGASSRVAVVVALAAVVALAVALRVPYLATRSIWYDESSSWQTASFPLAALPRSLRLNVHLPLYYLVLKAWMSMFGQSASAVRGLSVLCGAATAALVYPLSREVYLASRVGRGRVGRARGAALFALAAALAVALSPYQVNASIEARMYSLGTALTALSSWLLLRALRTAGAWPAWAAYSVSAAALLYCHPYAVFTVAMQVCFLLLCVGARLARGRRRRASWLARRIAIWSLVMAAAFLPGLALLTGQHNRVRRNYWLRPIDAPMLASTLVRFALPVYDHRQRRPYIEGLAVLGVLTAAAATIARGGRRGEVFLLLSGFGPMLLAALASLRTPIWEGRYFRFAHLFLLLLLLVLAIWRVTRRAAWPRALLLAALGCALCAANVAFWRLRDIPDRPGMRGAMREIVADYRPGETIVVAGIFHYFPAKFYAPPGVAIKLLESANREFWGRHLIRPGDLISPEELVRRLRRGVWFISQQPLASRAIYRDNPALANAIVVQDFEYEYDFGSPQWTVHVARCIDGAGKSISLGREPQERSPLP